MRVVFWVADHVILTGYSLPPDDVAYRAFLVARIRKSTEHKVRCSVVDQDDDYGSRWLYPEELQSGRDLPKAVVAARELFGPETSASSAPGFPKCFLTGPRGSSPTLPRDYSLGTDAGLAPGTRARGPQWLSIPHSAEDRDITPSSSSARHRTRNQLCGCWRSPTPAAAPAALEYEFIRFRLDYGGLGNSLRHGSATVGREKITV